MWRSLWVFLAVLALACSGPTPVERSEGTEPGDCEDGVDNDDDGLFDCDDPSCVGIPVCDAVDGGGTDAGPADAGSDAGLDAGPLVLCAVDERVLGNACVACPMGTTNAAGDDAGGTDTECDARLCEADERVSGNVCVACAAGTTNGAGDDASGTDTSCDITECGADERVVSNACVTCPAGSTNAAGDDASSVDTTCDGTLCASNQNVVSNACAACPAGSTNDAGDDATGPNTMCDAIICLVDQRVFSNACVSCAAGSTRAAGDDATGADTSCTPTFCATNQRVSGNMCMDCAPGTTRSAGDDATGADTVCDVTLCSMDQRVVSHACVACAAGTTNPVGDDASGADTTCEIIPLIFDLRGRAFMYAEGLIESFDEVATFPITLGGITATLTANQGVLNQTNGGFGVNSAGGVDDSDSVDGDAGIETVTITFGIDVVFRGIDVSALSGADAASMSVAGGVPVAITSSGFIDAGSASLTAGQTVVVAFVSGNGFNLDAIQINP